jgi:hypothetical protein
MVIDENWPQVDSSGNVVFKLKSNVSFIEGRMANIFPISSDTETKFTGPFFAQSITPGEKYRVYQKNPYYNASKNDVASFSITDWNGSAFDENYPGDVNNALNEQLMINNNYSGSSMCGGASLRDPRTKLLVKLSPADGVGLSILKDLSNAALVEVMKDVTSSFDYKTTDSQETINYDGILCLNSILKPLANSDASVNELIVQMTSERNQDKAPMTGQRWSSLKSKLETGVTEKNGGFPFKFSLITEDLNTADGRAITTKLYNDISNNLGGSHLNIKTMHLSPGTDFDINSDTAEMNAIYNGFTSVADRIMRTQTSVTNFEGVALSESDVQDVLDGLPTYFNGWALDYPGAENFLLDATKYIWSDLSKNGLSDFALTENDNALIKEYKDLKADDPNKQYKLVSLYKEIFHSRIYGVFEGESKSMQHVDINQNKSCMCSSVCPCDLVPGYTTAEQVKKIQTSLGLGQEHELLDISE